MANERPRLPANPETAWYEQRLRRRRWSLWLFNLVRVVVGLSFLSGGMNALRLHLAVPAIVLTTLAMLLFWVGVSDTLAMAGPVPQEEVDKLRQYGRAELFRRAHGKLPWQYSGWGRELELLTAALLAVVAVTANILTAPEYRPWNTTVVFLLLAAGATIDALIVKPRRARSMARRSAAELAARLSAGEQIGVG